MQLVTEHQTQPFPNAAQHSSVKDLLGSIQLKSGESLSSQVYEILWNLIITVRLRPGQLVSEKEISESLQASKTPVREALIRLEESGLVEVIPKSGTYVTPIRINTYIDACFIRLQLEVGAVKRATQRSHDIRRLALLDAILEKQIQAMERQEYEPFFTLDESLHETIFAMAGVAGAWNVVKRTQSEVYRIRHLKRTFNLSQRPKVVNEHRDIIAAIKSGDVNNAEKAMVDHIGPLESELDELSALPELMEFIEFAASKKSRTRLTGESRQS